MGGNDPAWGKIALLACHRALGLCPTLHWIFSPKHCSLAPEKCSVFMSVFHLWFGPITPVRCEQGEQGQRMAPETWSASWRLQPVWFFMLNGFPECDKQFLFHLEWEMGISENKDSVPFSTPLTSSLPWAVLGRTGLFRLCSNVTTDCFRLSAHME